MTERLVEKGIETLYKRANKIVKKPKRAGLCRPETQRGNLVEWFRYLPQAPTRRGCTSYAITSINVC